MHESDKKLPAQRLDIKPPFDHERARWDKNYRKGYNEKYGEGSSSDSGHNTNDPKDSISKHYRKLTYEASRDLQWLPEEIKDELRAAKERVAHHFGSIKNVQNHHRLSRKQSLHLINLLDDDQLDKLGKDIRGTDNFARLEPTKQFQIIKNDRSGIFTGFRTEENKSSVHPVYLQVKDHCIKVRDTPTVLYSFISNFIYEGVQKGEIPDEDVNTMCKCFMVIHNYQDQVLPSGEIDTDISGWTWTGNTFTDGPRQLSQEEFDRRRCITKSIDAIKELPGTIKLAPDNILAYEYLGLDGELNIVNESIIKNRGGLPRTQTDNLASRAKQIYEDLPRRDRRDILDGFAKRTGEDPTKMFTEELEANFYEYTDSYFQSLTTDKDVKYETLYAQYASKISKKGLKEGYEFPSEMVKMFETMGGLPKYDAKRVLEEATKNTNFDHAEYNHFKEYLRELTRMEGIGKSYGQVAHEFWQEWLNPNDNTIQTVETVFQSLKGKLSEEDAQQFVDTVVSQGKSFPTNTYSPMIEILGGTTEKVAAYFTNLFANFTKKKVL